MATAAIIANDDGLGEVSPSLVRLARIAQTKGNLLDGDLLTDEQITTIAADCIADYRRDCADRKPWEDVARKALKRAAQERVELKNPPPYRRSNVDYPILTVAAYQFNARAYPAICRPGEMVKVRVIGSDKGRPETDDQGRPLVRINGEVMTYPQAAAMMAEAVQGGPQPSAQPGMNGTPGIGDNGGPPLDPEPVWQIAPGAKQARADRVGDYLNVYLTYRLKNWEADTDAMLTQIPAVGCGFRKVWPTKREQRAAYISALDLVVPQSAKSLDTTPRVTEIMRDVYPYEIERRMAAGTYITADLLPDGDDTQSPRDLLEQHCFIDLDGDGLGEPYIVTLDEKTETALRIEADFAEDDVELSDDGRVIGFERRVYYIKYPFLPDPNGGFYDIGFGHLTEQVGDVVNVAINQMLDAGHAQIAGGGFLAAGVRLQDKRSDILRWQPGEYKTVQTSAQDLRAGIYERTFPEPSPILFQLLGLMMEAAKDITSVKDIVTGNAPNTAPVGTTLALIEQGLQVFTAIYKRIYRAAGEEFTLLAHNLGQYGGDAAAEDYMNVLDDPDADFEKDFSETDIDIKPIADPTAVTSAQRIAKAQVLASMRGQGLNDGEINRRILAAAGIDDIDKLLPPDNPAPNPQMMAQIAKDESQIRLNDASAQEKQVSAAAKAIDAGRTLGEGASDDGRVPDMAFPANNGMGAGGAGEPGAGAGGSMAGGALVPA